jgi:hypothetical protein
MTDKEANDWSDNYPNRCSGTMYSADKYPIKNQTCAREQKIQKAGLKIL